MTVEERHDAGIEDGEREAGAEECEPEKNLEAEKARCILS